MVKAVRLAENPILKPTGDWWQTLGVFNPGATIFQDKILLLYRAQGNDHISRFGLALSDDVINFTSQKEPVFEGSISNPYERLGVEDPRIIKVGDEYLIIFTGVSVYSGKEKNKLTWQRKAPWRVRTFLTKTKDFANFSNEEMILDFDTRDAVLFPEKIEDQFVLLHRVFPDMYISFSRDLTKWEVGKKILEPRAGFWDSERIGSGSPPFKTKLGWVHFYHGVDDKANYQLGVLVHNLNNPEKIIYRSEEPILKPEKVWEKEGTFPNVIFSCGAVEKDGKYLIYYGGADKVIGVAGVDKEELLWQLEKEIDQ